MGNRRVRTHRGVVGVVIGISLTGSSGLQQGLSLDEPEASRGSGHNNYLPLEGKVGNE